MFEEAAGQLQTAQIFPAYPYYEKGKNVVHKLLKEGYISESEYYELMGPELGKKALENNVFALHIGPGQVTFQSTVMKQFCKEVFA